MPERHRVLIVDDIARDRNAIVAALRANDVTLREIEADVLEACSIAEAQEAIRHEEFACVFLSHELPDGTSLDLMAQVRKLGLVTPVVVLTGERQTNQLVEVMRAGALEFIPREKLNPELVARSLRAAILFRDAQLEKRRVLDELRARDRAIAAAPNGIVIADPNQADCPIVYANGAFLKMTGYAEADVLGRNCRFLQGVDTDPEAVGEIRSAIQNQQACLVTILNYRKDGTEFWNQLAINPVLDQRGSLTHFVGVQTDITARKLADAERTRAENEIRQFKFLADSANDSLYLLDAGGYIRYVNPAACRSLGYEARELTGMRAMDIDTQYDLRAYSELFDRTKSGTLPRFETENRRKDGTTFPVEASVSRVEVGSESLLFASARDLSERKAAQKAARLYADREKLLADLAERTRGITDPDQVISDAVHSVGEFLGVDRCVFAEIDLEVDVCTVTPHYRRSPAVISMAGSFPISAFGPFLVESCGTGQIVVVDDIEGDKDKIPAEFIGAYLGADIRAFIAVPKLHSSRLVSVIAVHCAEPRHWNWDEVELLKAVVERTWLTVEVMRQERVLVHDAEVKNRILESMTDAFLTVDREWRYTYVNSRTEAVWGKSRDDILGMTVWDAWPDAVGTQFEYHFRRTMDDQIPVAFEEYFAPLGTWFEVRANPSPDGISVFFQDISARKFAADEREQRLLQEQRRADRETMLHRISDAIRSTADPVLIQTMAATCLGEELHADRCYFSFFDLDADVNWIGDDFRRQDLASLAGRYKISDFQVDPNSFYIDGRPLVISDTSSNDWVFPNALMEALRELRVRSCMSIPIYDSGQLVAALSVAMADVPRDWTDDEVSLAEAVAAQTRSAVESALLLAEQQARLRQEALIGRIGAAIRSELDPSAIQAAATALLGDALGADRCFYLTYDHGRDLAIVGRDFRHSDLPALTGEYNLSDFSDVLGELYSNRKTVSISDVDTAMTPAAAEVMKAYGAHAVLAVPLYDQGILMAALWASKVKPYAWTPHEISLLEQAATQTRTALESARVSQREHAISQQLQDALLPTIPEHVSGLDFGSCTQPALEEAEIGGDFFDVFPLDSTLYACVIGDVSGKGLAAAQQLALIRNSLRTTLYMYKNPALAVNALNYIVCTHDLLVGFVTAWVGIYNSDTREIKYCSCGHEPGLVRRIDGSIEFLDTNCPAIGVDTDCDFVESSFTMLTGDVLLVYTDGVSEAGVVRSEMLGTEGIAKYLQAVPHNSTAQQAAKWLFQSVSDYTDGVFRDDVAVLVAKAV